jgi:hypothetical protein
MDNPTVLESGEDGWPVLCDEKFEPINSLLVSGDIQARSIVL